jgi:lipoyl(octanoyl) transferase
LINEYKFRFAFTPRLTGAQNMEIDRILGEVMPPDMPLVRFYTWDKSTISLGCNQNLSKRIDLELCAKDDIPVVMRPTGGRELLHGHDICYCVARPHEPGMTAIEAKKVFAEINNALIDALIKMGINASWGEFKSRPQAQKGPCFAQVDSGEITVGGRKLVASAQRVFSRCIIQEGSIPLTRPSIDLIKYLVLPEREILRQRIAEVSTFLYAYVDESVVISAVVDYFKASFEESFQSQAGNAESLLDTFDGIKSIQ